MGVHKLMVLNPPALAYVHLEDVKDLARAQDTFLYIRISHPQGDYTSAVPVTLANLVRFHPNLECLHYTGVSA